MRKFKADELEIIQRVLLRYDNELIRRLDSLAQDDIIRKITRIEREKVRTIIRDIVNELIKD